MVLVLIHDNDNGLHITRRIAGYSHVALCRTHLRLLLEQQLTTNATISFSPTWLTDGLAYDEGGHPRPQVYTYLQLRRLPSA